MNNNPNSRAANNDNSDDTDVAESVAEVLEAAELGAQAAADECLETEADGEPDPYEVLATENADLKDKVLRLAAEMENLRRRAEREKAEATLYAASNFARDMLGVSDNMDRALETVSAEQRETADEVTRNLLQGVEMVQRELLNIFERHGIRRINPLDERFDPNMHQAMFEVPDEAKPNGTVVQVVQPGFVIGERVLRPAMVAVSKGGPKPAAPSDGASGNPA